MSNSVKTTLGVVVFVLHAFLSVCLHAQKIDNSQNYWKNTPPQDIHKLKGVEDYKEKPLPLYGVLLEEDSIVINRLQLNGPNNRLGSMNIISDPPPFSCFKRCFTKVTLRLVFENTSIDNNSVGYDYRYAGVQPWNASIVCTVKTGNAAIATNPVQQTLTISNNTPAQVFEIDITNKSHTCTSTPSYDQVINIDRSSYSENGGTSTIFDDVKLRAYIIREVRVDESINYYKVVHTLITTANPGQVNRPMNFKWSLLDDNNSPCASVFKFPNYQFQILKLSNIDPAKQYNENTIKAKVDWSQALSFETYSSNPSVVLTIAEGRGFYIWRVRGIGTKEPGGIIHPNNWGEWSDYSIPDGAEISIDRSLTDTSAHTYNAVTITDIIPQGQSSINSVERPKYLKGVFFYRSFDDDLNWIYSRNFSEGSEQTGVQIGEKITYANKLNQEMQEQVKIASKDSLLISVTGYDFVGRAVLKSLAAPLDKKGFGYHEKAFKGSSGLFNAFDFDADAKIFSPTPITTETIGGYYSGNHPVQTIPSANGYPYTRTLQESNPIARVVEQGGVGNQHLGSGKNVRTEYLPTSEDELVSIFGHEAPKAENVSKIKTTDPNGVVSIAYELAEGKTIATCLLSTQNATDFLALTTSENSTPAENGERVNNITMVDTARGIMETGPGKYIASTRFALSSTKVCSLNYSISRKKLESDCPNFCKYCDYRITLKILKVGEFGKLVAVIGQDDQILDKVIDTNCAGNAVVTYSRSLTLDAGTYEIQRVVELDNTITISQPSGPPIVKKNIDAYIDEETDKFSKHLYADANAPALYKPSFLERMFGTDIHSLMDNSVSLEQKSRMYENLLNTYATKYNNATTNERNSTPLATGDFSCYTTNLPAPNCRMECAKSEQERDFGGYLLEKVQSMSAPPFTNYKFVDAFKIPKVEVEPISGEAKVMTSDYYESLYSGLTETQAVAEFNQLIANMIAAGYDCQDLWRCWRSLVDAYPTMYEQSTKYKEPVRDGNGNLVLDGNGQPIVSETPIYTNAINMLELFLDCTGRKICDAATTKSDYRLNAFSKVMGFNFGSTVPGYTLLFNQCIAEIANELEPPNNPPALACQPAPSDNSMVYRNYNKIRSCIDGKSKALVNQRAIALNDQYLTKVFNKLVENDSEENKTTKKDCCKPGGNGQCCKDLLEKKDVCESKCDKMVADEMKELFMGYYIQGEPYKINGVDVSFKNIQELEAKGISGTLFVYRSDYDCWLGMARSYCYAHCDPNHPQASERLTKVMTGKLKLKRPIPETSYDCEPGYELINNAVQVLNNVVGIMNRKLQEFRDQMETNGPEMFVINELLDEILNSYPMLQVYCKTAPDNTLSDAKSIRVYKNDISEFFVYVDPNNSSICRIGYRTIGGESDYSIYDNPPAPEGVHFQYEDNCYPPSPIPQTLPTYPTRTWDGSLFLTYLNHKTRSLFPVKNSYGNTLYGDINYFRSSNPNGMWLWEFIGNVDKGIDSCTSQIPLMISGDIYRYVKWNPPIHMTQFHSDTLFSALDRTDSWEEQRISELGNHRVECINGTNFGTFTYNDIIFRPSYTITGAYVTPYTSSASDDTRKFIILGRLLYQVRNPLLPNQIDSIEFSLEPASCAAGSMSNTLNVIVKINNVARSYPIAMDSYAALKLLDCNNNLNDDYFFRYFGYFDVNSAGYLIFNDAQGGNDNGSVPDYVFQHIRFNCTNPNCDLDTMALFCMPCSATANCATPLCAKWLTTKTYPPIYFERGIGCEQQEVERLINHFTYTFKQQHKKAMDTLRARYTRICANPKAVTDVYTVKYSEGYMHYTLYYYDRSGKLVKTVPPKGVYPLSGPPYLRTVSSTPNHQFVTTYHYNTMGQLVEQNTPDGGTTKFVYDEKGRVRFSQNAKQLNASPVVYSYIKYDKQENIIEEGEISGSLPSVANANDPDYPANSYSSPSVVFATKIVYGGYDAPAISTLPAPYNSGTKRQRYVFNRICTTLTKQRGITGSGIHEVKTYYSYDPHGNVEWMIQDIPTLAGASRTDYEYDLISNKITDIKYRDGYPDCFYQHYTYDADNALLSVSTSRDGKVWDRDARYNYYGHGSLRRTVLGEDAVQGIDYTFTVEGALKAINHPYLPDANGNPGAYYDPGRDGQTNTPNVNTARDAFGMILCYNSTDFIRTNSIFNQTVSRPTTDMQLYNGNIASFLTGYRGLYVNGSVPSDITAGVYKYDYINRLRKDENKIYAHAGTTWTSTPTDKWKNTYDYDPNGNITRLERFDGGTMPVRFDSLTYKYVPNTNKLRHIDEGSTVLVNYDIDDQNPDNYGYDEIGNLKYDSQEGISSGTPILWTPANKPQRIIKTVPGITTTLSFLYDALGNRVAKRISTVQNSVTTNKWTWYVRDAQGNTMATYTRTGDNTGAEIFAEAPIYDGTERIGMFVPNMLRSGGGSTNGINSIYSRTLGLKFYELKDHLGNVRVVIEDKKLSTTGSAPFNASVISFSNYYPYGMLYKDGATVLSDKYRYGYNGKEKDDELKGEGNSYDYGARLYDSRVARFLSTDPLQSKFSDRSPYAYANNNPIIYIDKDGKKGVRPSSSTRNSFRRDRRSGQNFGALNTTTSGQTRGKLITNIFRTTPPTSRPKPTSQQEKVDLGLPNEEDRPDGFYRLKPRESQEPGAILFTLISANKRFNDYKRLILDIREKTQIETDPNTGIQTVVSKGLIVSGADAIEYALLKAEYDSEFKKRLDEKLEKIEEAPLSTREALTEMAKTQVKLEMANEGKVDPEAELKKQLQAKIESGEVTTTTVVEEVPTIKSAD